MIMKILTINASPRGKEGCTFKMLEPLLKGMQQANAKTEIIHLGKLNIHHCIGCLACWTKTPGKCVFDDDMASLLPKLIEADLIIYGTPLYYYTMTGLLKNFMDRTIPLASPYMIEGESNKNITSHPKRYEYHAKKTLLVSPCGFPEYVHFEPLVFTFKHIAKSTNSTYLGEILRPAAPLLCIDHFKKESSIYFENLKKAGQQLIEQEKINDDLMKFKS